MKQRRTEADDEGDRELIMQYVRAHPGETFEEAELKRQTGVAKGRVRRLVRDEPGIDLDRLEKGAIRYNPPAATT